MWLYKNYQYLPRTYGLCLRNTSVQPSLGLLHSHTPAPSDEDILEARNFSLLFKGSIFYFSSLALVQIYETTNGILLVLSMPTLCLPKDEMNMKIRNFSLTIWDILKFLQSSSVSKYGTGCNTAQEMRVMEQNRSPASHPALCFFSAF